MTDPRRHADDYTALRRAVLGSPADDVPRLVLADWLDDHGESPRAAYIRASVDLAALVRAERYDEEYVAAGRLVASVPPEVVWGWVRGDGLPVPPPHLLTRDLVGDADRIRSVHHDATVGVRRGFAALVRWPRGGWAAGSGRCRHRWSGSRRPTAGRTRTAAMSGCGGGARGRRGTS